MSNITIEHSSYSKHIYVKVSFDNWMSDFAKHSAFTEWESIKKQVDDALKLIRSPEDEIKRSDRTTD